MLRGVAALSRTWRVLLTIGREMPESRIRHPAEEDYREAELVYEAVTPARADHQVRLITKYATKLGFKVRAKDVHCCREVPGPEC